jgi:hypothetical protein
MYMPMEDLVETDNGRGGRSSYEAVRSIFIFSLGKRGASSGSGYTIRGGVM